MIVTSDAPRAEPRERGLDPAPYSYAVPFASSFVAILNEIAPRDRDAARQTPPEQTAEASKPQSDTAAPAADTPEADSADSVQTEVTANETAPENDEDAPAALDSEASPPIAAADETAEVAVAEPAPETRDNLTAAVPAPEHRADAVPQTGATPTAPVEVTEVAAPVTPAPLPPVPQGTTPAPITGTNADETPPAGADPDGESADTPAAAPFPKTLNALLAESAVRKAGIASDTPERSPETVPVQDAPAQAPEDAAPTPPQPSRVAAMELGGVRADTAAMPRIPLANLPGELAGQIHLMQQEGAKTMRIRIVPENLGELRIEIHGTGDTLRVRMISANPAVRDALDSQMGDLKQALQKQGLSPDNVTVDAGPGRDDTPQRREQSGQAPKLAAGTAPATNPAGRPDATAVEIPGAPSGTLNILA